MRFLREHHRRHHHPRLMQRWNFNVTIPLFDWLHRSVVSEKVLAETLAETPQRRSINHHRAGRSPTIPTGCASASVSPTTSWKACAPESRQAISRKRWKNGQMALLFEPDRRKRATA
ncbi:MAG: hypothetical protein IPJ34_24170 [Myxococcales bacterium]|nr:hypothetical protein [Myxococcales bacterium]